jgi:hypothetical protein
MTSRKPTTATTTETPPSSGDGGSVTFLHSDDAGSQTLSSRPVQEPATNSTLTVIGPSDVSDMSPTEAAYWIATEGGSRELDINDPDVWRPAFAQLLKTIVNDEVAVLGRRVGDGLYQKVPSDQFRHVNISYPYCGQPSDLVSGNDPYLQCWGILDEEHQRNGFDDKLFVRRLELEWGHLRVKGVDVARHWPFAKAARKGRHGPKTQYDWPDVRDYVFQTMNKRGEFHDPNIDSDGWYQADLERLVMRYLENEPSESTVRKNITQSLAEWRAQHGEADN